MTLLLRSTLVCFGLPLFIWTFVRRLVQTCLTNVSLQIRHGQQGSAFSVWTLKANEIGAADPYSGASAEYFYRPKGGVILLLFSLFSLFSFYILASFQIDATRRNQFNFLLGARQSSVAARTGKGGTASLAWPSQVPKRVALGTIFGDCPYLLRYWRLRCWGQKAVSCVINLFPSCWRAIDNRLTNLAFLLFLDFIFRFYFHVILALYFQFMCIFSE